jgi:hypothetical protein
MTEPQLTPAQAVPPDADLAAIAARANAATPGPWCTDNTEIYQGSEYRADAFWVGETCRVDGPDAPADAEFIAHARTDVPALLARVAELEAQAATTRATTLREAAEHTRQTCPTRDEDTGPCIPCRHAADRIDRLADLAEDAAAPSPQPGTPEHAAGAEQLLAAARGVDDEPVTVYRASFDGSEMGLYTSREAARAHCETLLRREVGEEMFLGWVPDHGGSEAPEELCTGHDVECSGYWVAPVTAQTTYQADAEAGDAR